MGRAILAACAAGNLCSSATLPAASSERYVLLVGVGKYPSLKPAFQLAGPPNDMRLMRDVLEGDPFRVTPAHITVLTDWQTDKSLLPTRGNIEREFARLAGVVQKGDQVFILMGGHGSQQPADNDPADFEPDGLDEIFLPSDVRGWDGSKGRVVNAIVDDEIRTWLDRIRKPGAFVWIAFDSCHSGTMIRGAPSSVERERQVPIEELVPQEARRRVRTAESARGGPAATGRPQGELGTDAGDVFALYAAQPYETTPESGDPAYGLFTLTMSEVLKQARSPLTYRELAEGITERYRSMNRVAPTPMFEGTAADREVLGQASWPDRAQWTLAHDSNKRLIVNAGRLVGLTQGSVLEVFPPAGTSTASTAVGFVKVVELRPLESVVEPAAFNSTAVTLDRLVPGSRCRLAQADFGEMTLRVGLQRQRDGPPAAENVETIAVASAPPAIGKAMARLSELTKGLARPVDRPTEADWFVRLLADGRVVLVPASGMPRPAEQSRVKPPTFEVARAIDESFEAKLVANVTRMARAKNLVAIAGAGIDQRRGGPGALSMKVELLRYSSDTASVGTPVDFGPEGRVLRVGEHVAFRLTNTGDTDIDATLLLVDADFKIESLFPQRGNLNNRLDRGKTYTTRLFTVQGPLGAEQVVTIAVPASTPPVSFAALEQDPLVQSRGARDAKSPLGRLLDRAMDGVGATRSLGSPELATHSITLLSWRTEPARKD